MPFTIQGPPVLPQPPPVVGPTASAPVNIAMGTTLGAGSNAAMTAIAGPEVTEAAFGVGLLFQALKHCEWYDQERFWPVTLVVLGVGIFVVLAILTQRDMVESVLRGFAAAWQANLNYHAAKVAGLGLLEPAANP